MKILPKIAKIPQFAFLSYLAKWLLLALPIGFAIGSAVAFFLHALDWATNWRENHVWIIALLPFAGFAIGLAYHYFGESVVKGNNLLIEEFHNPKQVIPLRMAPLVLFGTLATHLFGGSAGREGTAVQMGGAIADQFSKYFKLASHDRKILIAMGISAGFAAVFGTPVAAAVFALEVLALGGLHYDAILPSFLVAAVADRSCSFWNVSHTHYQIPNVPALDAPNFGSAVVSGLAFGLAALLFSRAVHFFTAQFKIRVSYAPLRPVIGGAVIAVCVFALGTTTFIGLGIPVIVESFRTNVPVYYFALKLLFTTFTLGAGFKGGEVTPLFFVGATLGSALALVLPLPTALLAGMGFAAVFSGATNTPVACTLMAIELFGAQGAAYFGIACVVAFIFSGRNGIYTAQRIGRSKHFLFATPGRRMPPRVKKE